MKQVLRLLLLLPLLVGTIVAQDSRLNGLDSTKSKPATQTKLGLYGSAGIYHGFRQPEGICFDCTPREYQTTSQNNALATFGMVAALGKPTRHLGIRGALGIAYQQIKWDYEVEFRPRGLPLQQTTVHLRANRLMLDLNFRLYYSTLGRRPLVFQLGFFTNGFLTRGSQSYSTTPNRSAYFQQQIAPPIGAIANISFPITTKTIVVEPFLESRYSFRKVIADPDVTSGSLQLGLIAWLPQ